MIFVSDHAFISKWWWIGAIRKTRRPQYLKETTCRITDSASSAKMPPISSSRTIVFVKIAIAASAPPIAIGPVARGVAADVDDDADRGVGDERDDAAACSEPVDAVGQVDAVRRAGDDEEAED